jgi:large subunit ribosomal protein L25
VGDSIHIENLNLPQGVTSLVDPSQIVVSILGRQAGAEAAELEDTQVETAAS